MSVMELHDPCVTLHLSLPTWPWLPRLELVPWSCIPLACQHLLGQVGNGLHKTWHWWGTWTGCPENLLHPWKCSRMGWMGLEATWDSGRFPWPWQVGWNKMIFMIHSYWCLRKDISTQSILWFYECLQSVWVVPCLLCQVWLRPRVCSELQKVLSVEQSRDPTRVLRAECVKPELHLSSDTWPWCVLKTTSEEQQALHRLGPSVGTIASCFLSLPPTPV